MPQPPKRSLARDPLWNPRACARIACLLRRCPRLIVSADGRLYAGPSARRLKRASCPFSLPSLFTRQLKCAFNTKVKTPVFWLLTLSAIRNIADKDCRPNEPHGRGERGCRAGSESAPVRLASKLPEGMAKPQYFAQGAGVGPPPCGPTRLRLGR